MNLTEQLCAAETCSGPQLIDIFVVVVVVTHIAINDISMMDMFIAIFVVVAIVIVIVIVIVVVIAMVCRVTIIATIAMMMDVLQQQQSVGLAM